MTAPATCPACSWSTGAMLNYGKPGEPLWMCHGCATRHIAALTAQRDEARSVIALNLPHGQHRGDVDAWSSALGQIEKLRREVADIGGEVARMREVSAALLRDGQAQADHMVAIAAEADRMRPVVAAAEAWRGSEAVLEGDEVTHLEVALWNAVDAYRGAP